MRSRTSGITTDHDGNKIVSKQHKGQFVFARLGRVTQEEAETWLAKRIEEIRQTRVYGVRPQRTFREASIKYLNEAVKRTLDCDAYHIGLVDPWVGHLMLHQVHDATLAPFVTHRLAQGVSPTTIKRSLEVVRRILNLAARSWRNDSGLTWLATAPLIAMPTNLNPRKPYPLSWDEQRILFSELPAHLGHMALFKVNTGTREQEVCGLRWDWEVRVPELRTSVFLIPGTRVKNGEDRLVVLNSVARSVIEDCRGDHRDRIFAYRGKPTDSINNSAWRKARSRAAVKWGEETGEEAHPGFARVRVHDLKHTFGRRLRAAGVPLETRKVLLGHTNGDITSHYSAVEIGELIAAAERALATRSTPTLLRVKTG
jgi:integrase